MIHLVGGEDLLAFPFFVDLVLLGDLHGPHHLFGLSVHQQDFLADLDGVGFALVDGHGDRDGPEGAVGEFHSIAAGALPVVVAHEASQRGEAADAHHDEVADFPGGQGDCGQFLSPLLLFGHLGRGKQ